MDVIVAALYLVFCWLVSSALLRRLPPAGAPSISERMVSRSVALAACFFIPYLVLGFAALLLGRPLVHTAAAAAILLVLLAISRMMQGSQSLPPVPLRGMLRRARKSRTGTLAAVLLMLVLLPPAALTVLGHPKGYEALSYHLPLAVHFSQTHTLGGWESAYMHAFPANVSVYFAFLLELRPERLVSAGNLVFLPLLGAAIYGIARRLGAVPEHAAVAGLSILSVPMLLFSAFQCASDLGGLAMLACALFFMVGAADAPSRREAVLAGLALGLSVGFKSLHLVPLAVVAMIFAVRALASHRPRWAAPAALVCLTALGGCGFWLLRNWLEFGNPLYPVHPPIVGDLLDWAKAPDIDYGARSFTQYEWVRSIGEWPLYPWVEWHARSQNFKHSSGLGAYFAALVPCAIVFTTLARFERKPRMAMGSLLLVGGLTLLVWWIMGDRQPRYALGAVVAALPFPALLLTRCRGFSARYLHALALLTIVLMTAILSALHTASSAAQLTDERWQARSRFYGYPKEADQLPAGSTILNLAARTWNYPLTGEGQRNRVVSYLEGLHLAAFQVTPAMSEGDPSDWPQPLELNVDRLRAKGVTHVFTTWSARVSPNGLSLVPLGGSRRGRIGFVLYRVVPTSDLREGSAPARPSPSSSIAAEPH